LTCWSAGRSAGIGATSGLALLLGGIYLIARGYVRWEIPSPFVAACSSTATMFHLANPAAYAGPLFHLFTGFSLIGAFFLATDDSASPVNTIPMLIYGAVGGIMTMLIRNIGAYAGRRDLCDIIDQPDQSTGRQNQTQGDWKGSIKWVK
jgi:Na+-translocating ferredoxin:NAD+ oxidoreductase subunit D